MIPRTRLLLVLLGIVVSQPSLHAWSVSRSASIESATLLAAGAPPAGQCAFSLSATSASVPSTGSASATVSVVTGTSCSWTATSHAPWITVISSATGTGLGWVSYAVAANATGSQRTGTLTIAGITFTVTQGATSCAYNLSATSASYPSAGTTSGALSVVTGTSCSWTAVSQASWITIISGTAGTGIGSVAYTVAANSGAQRTGTMTIGGLTFTVTQAGGATTLAAPTGLRILP